MGFHRLVVEMRLKCDGRFADQVDRILFENNVKKQLVPDDLWPYLIK